MNASSSTTLRQTTSDRKPAGALRRRMVHAAAVSLAMLGIIAGAPAQAQPAMWAIKDADSTIYALGTVHLLKPDMDWKTPAIKAAIAEADELWLELPTTNPEAMASEMMGLIQKYGLSLARPLSADLSEEERKVLDEAARPAGLTGAQLEPFRPWFAAITLSTSAIVAAGFDPQSGVDSKVEAAFAERNIKPRGLETPEQQIRVFADMKREDELAFLRQTMNEFEQAEEVMNGLVDAWAKGDIEGLDELLVTEMRSSSEDLYQALLVGRNANWVADVMKTLEGSGVSFLAVGAAHLIGEDSLLAMLAKKGVTIERVQ